MQVTVSGRVQGVGYRWHVRDAAIAHGVTGWVRNRRDGSVEAELHGTEDAVAAVMDAIRRGPAHARVTDVAVTAAPSTPVGGFDILPTA